MTNSLRIRPPSATLEACEQALWNHGALALTLLDAADQPLLEPGPGEMPLWHEVTLEALLPDDTDAAVLVLELVARGLIDSPADSRLEAVPERDWVRAWMDRFRPMRFGESLWICPGHIAPDPAWPVVVRLDPGLAFGTGTHPTTALCLEWIDAGAFGGQTVIDYGCGSGVLAIATALKGAAQVIAVDHDPQALTATADNAARNGIADRITVCLPDDLAEARADVVLANILAGPLVELAPRLIDALAPGGRLVVSGLLTEQIDEVRNAYAGALQSAGERLREQWAALEFRSPPGQSDETTTATAS